MIRDVDQGDLIIVFSPDGLRRSASNSKTFLIKSAVDSLLPKFGLQKLDRPGKLKIVFELLVVGVFV